MRSNLHPRGIGRFFSSVRQDQTRHSPGDHSWRGGHGSRRPPPPPVDPSVEELPAGRPLRARLVLNFERSFSTQNSKIAPNHLQLVACISFLTLTKSRIQTAPSAFRNPKVSDMPLMIALYSFDANMFFLPSRTRIFSNSIWNQSTKRLLSR
jgi:hypothetical protein